MGNWTLRGLADAAVAAVIAGCGGSAKRLTLAEWNQGYAYCSELKLEQFFRNRHVSAPTTGGLVGRGSRHPDPLIRSSVAGSVVANCVTAVLSHTTDRALWEHKQPRVTITGSFF